MLSLLIWSRRVVLSALIAALIVPSVPLSLSAAAGAAQNLTGVISGIARSASGPPMRGVTVQLRNLQNGRLAGTTTSDSAGQFSFGALASGEYAVEIVNAGGEVVATSTPVFLSGSTMIASGLTITMPATSLAAPAAGGSFLASTLGIVTAAAIGAGVVGVTVAATSEEASPSR